jgi:hypothetical protein
MNLQAMMEAGGKRLMSGADEVWYFGWNPPVPLDPEHDTVREAAAVSDDQDAANRAFLRAMPSFGITGNDQGNDEKVLLYELWKHPEVVAANGRAFSGIYQKSGSCVGAGGGTVIATLSFVEVVRLGDPEQALIPFWLLPYGRSRFYGGMRGPGEGSFGSAFAEAMLKDGIIPANISNLPQPTEDDGMLTWGKPAEMTWSAGDRISEDWLTQSRRHLVKTAAKLSNADQVRDAIRNGYPVTCASMYAHNGGTVTGTPQVLLGRRSGSWAHQMSIMAWWNHPTLGDIFYLMNQWGQGAHGTCPSGAPRGGVWITKADMDWICRDEVFAFSQFSGFPATTFNWANM